MSLPPVQEFADPDSIIEAITDNGGETLDRYTVWFRDGSYLGLSETGAGFSQWGEAFYSIDFPDAVLQWLDLAEPLRRHITARYFYCP